MRIFIFALLACLFVGCGTMISGSVERKIKLETVKNSAGEVIAADIKEAKKSGSSYNFLYTLCAIVAIAIAIGIAVVTKDMKSASIAAGGALLFLTAPFYIEILREILGPLTWCINVILACGTIGFIGYAFFKLRNLFHDLVHTDDDDLHPETAKIATAARKHKAIVKIKKK